MVLLSVVSVYRLRRPDPLCMCSSCRSSTSGALRHLAVGRCMYVQHPCMRRSRHMWHHTNSYTLDESRESCVDTESFTLVATECGVLVMQLAWIVQQFQNLSFLCRDRRVLDLDVCSISV